MFKMLRNLFIMIATMVMFVSFACAEEGTVVELPLYTDGGVILSTRTTGNFPAEEFKGNMNRPTNWEKVFTTDGYVRSEHTYCGEYRFLDMFRADRIEKYEDGSWIPVEESKYGDILDEIFMESKSLNRYQAINGSTCAEYYDSNIHSLEYRFTQVDSEQCVVIGWNRISERYTLLKKRVAPNPDPTPTNTPEPTPVPTAKPVDPGRDPEQAEEAKPVDPGRDSEKSEESKPVDPGRDSEESAEPVDPGRDSGNPLEAEPQDQGHDAEWSAPEEVTHSDTLVQEEALDENPLAVPQDQGRDTDVWSEPEVVTHSDTLVQETALDYNPLAVAQDGGRDAEPSSQAAPEQPASEEALDDCPI